MDWQKFSKSGHAVGQNCFHLTWTTKYRYPVFRFPKYVKEMRSILYKVAERHNITIHNLCIEPDHIHCFVSFPPTLSLAQVTQFLKGGSSYEFRKLHPKMLKYKALWSIGKFYRSIGTVTTEAVQRYINDTHHTTRIPISQKRLI